MLVREPHRWECAEELKSDSACKVCDGSQGCVDVRLALLAVLFHSVAMTEMIELTSHCYADAAVKTWNSCALLAVHSDRCIPCCRGRLIRRALRSSFHSTLVVMFLAALVAHRGSVMILEQLKRVRTSFELPWLRLSSHQAATWRRNLIASSYCPTWNFLAPRAALPSWANGLSRSVLCRA
jgi:hypothetical protein